MDMARCGFPHIKILQKMKDDNQCMCKKIRFKTLMRAQIFICPSFFVVVVFLA